MSRWITVTRPFDYRWPDASAITAFREEHLGEHHVKDELADFAIAGKHAKEGRKAGSTTRSVKGGPRAARAARAKQETADIANHVTPHERATKAPSTRRATSRSRAGNKAIDATAANLQPNAPLGGANNAADDNSAARRAVDPSAS